MLPLVSFGPLEAIFDALVGTFGPFVIPAGVFLAGVLGYGVLLWLNRRREYREVDSSPGRRQRD